MKRFLWIIFGFWSALSFADGGGGINLTPNPKALLKSTNTWTAAQNFSSATFSGPITVSGCTGCGGGGGGGSASLSVGQGSSVNFTQISSPTTHINFSTGPFTVSLISPTTALIRINYSSVTAQGYIDTTTAINAISLATATRGGTIVMSDEGGTPGASISLINCVGSAISCSQSGSTETITITASGGGGGSTLAVGTGSAQAGMVVSSPTAVIIFSTPTFSVKLTGTATAFVDISSYPLSQLHSTDTYRTAQDLMNLFVSAGRITGGAITIAATANKVDISSGTGWIKAVDSDATQIYFFDWPSSSSVVVPSGATRYIGVQYNSNNPFITAKSADSWDYDTEFPLGVAVNEGGVLYITTNPWQSGDNMTNVIERFESLALVSRDNRAGGLILSNTGTRNVSVTAGTLLARMSEFTISAIDTSGSGTFDAYYRNGSGGFTKQSAQTQWNNSQYDDASGTLASLTVLNFTSRWFYVMTDGSLAMVYGQAQYSSLAGALNDGVPSSVPDRILKEGVLIGRFIIQASGATPSATQSAFGTSFTAASVTSFSDLSGQAKPSQVEGYESYKTTNTAALAAVSAATSALANFVSTFTTIQWFTFDVPSLAALATGFATLESSVAWQAGIPTIQLLVPRLVRAFDGSATEYVYGELQIPTGVDVSSNVLFSAIVTPKTAGGINKNVQVLIVSTATALPGNVYNYTVSTGADVCSMPASSGTTTSCTWSQSVTALNWLGDYQAFFGLTRAHDTSKLGAFEMAGDLYIKTLRIGIPVVSAVRVWKP